MLKVDKDSCLIEFDFEKIQWVVYGPLDNNLILIDSNWDLYESGSKYKRDRGVRNDYVNKQEIIGNPDLIIFK